MAKHSATKVREYVDAKRALDQMKVQRIEHPELDESLVWKKNFTFARVEADTAFRALTGGELARARLMLREEGVDFHD